MDGAVHQGIDYGYYDWHGAFPSVPLNVVASNSGEVVFVRHISLDDSYYWGESLKPLNDYPNNYCYDYKGSDEKSCDWRKKISETMSGRGETHGNLIIIYHKEDGLYTKYSHLLYGSVVVKVGDYVNIGDTLARVGNNGASSVPHLHFEMRNMENAIVNPNDHIGKSVSENVIENNSVAGVMIKNGQVAVDIHTDSGVNTPSLKDYKLNLGEGIYNVNLQNFSVENIIVTDKTQLISVYIDENQNGVYDEIDILFKGDQLDVDIDKVKSLQKLQISQNWNAYQITLSNESYVSSRDVMAQVETLDQHLEFAVFRGGQWVIQKYDTVYKSLFGEDIELVDGEVIFIKGNIDGSLVLVGDDLILNSEKVDLSAGWNFIAFNADTITASNLTSYSLLNKCNEAGLICESLSTYEGRVNNTVINKNDKLFGVDFPLEPNKPYIIKVDGEGGELKF